MSMFTNFNTLSKIKEALFEREIFLLLDIEDMHSWNFLIDIIFELHTGKPINAHTDNTYHLNNTVIPT